MADPIVPTPPPAPVIVHAAPIPVDWNIVLKWLAAGILGASIYGLELTGHADPGTFLNYFALPGLTFLGIHTAAKGLN